MHPPTTNRFLQTYDVYSFGFESAGALEIVNEFSGLAVSCRSDELAGLLDSANNGRLVRA